MNSTVKARAIDAAVFLIIMMFCLTAGAGLASGQDCVVTPKGLTLSFSGTVPTAGSPITYTVDTASDCASSIYYYFSYNPNYGTAQNDPNNWINMRDVFWSTNPSLTHMPLFSTVKAGLQVGYYYLRHRPKGACGP